MSKEDWIFAIVMIPIGILVLYSVYRTFRPKNGVEEEDLLGPGP
jgi:hypothetical protein